MKAKLVAHLADPYPATSATPPRITPGSANPTASAIANSTGRTYDRAEFRYVGRVSAASDIFPDQFYGTSRTVNYGGGKSANFYYIEFATDSQSLEIVSKGTDADQFRILVDGSYANTDPIAYPTDGNSYFTRVDFASKATRTLRIETSGLYFAGINVSVGDTVSAPPAVDPVRAVVLGDSFTEGAGARVAYEGYSAELGRRMGWGDLYSSGVGSTGYLAAPQGKLTFRQRIQGDVYDLQPEVLVIAGGINDLGSTAAAVETEARALFDDIAGKLPNTVVFVLGPWNPNACCAALAAPIRAAAAGHANVYFIDNVGERWQTGTGSVAAPKGDGNGDLYTSADGVHPSPAGHVYLAQRLAADLRAIIAGF